MHFSGKNVDLNILKNYSIDVLFIDHTFLYAYINKEDKKHTEANQIMSMIKNVKYIPVIYLNTAVFTRVVTKILRKKNKHVAEQVVKEIINSSILKLLIIDNEIFDEAIQYFLDQRYINFDWEFLDWINFVMIKKRNIQYILAFHKHAEQAQRLFNFTVIKSQAYTKSIKYKEYYSI